MDCSLILRILLVTGVFSIIYGKPAAPKKVAILGGGAASCTAALALTGQPGWKERYDVTIYQLGWRLGGKARSGRNKNYGQRTEEITDHAIPAIYHNTKQLLQYLYRELDRPEGSPMRTFEEAFKLVGMFSLKPLNISVDDEDQCFSMHHILKNVLRKALKATMALCDYMKTPFPEIDTNISDDLLLNTVMVHLVKKWVNEIENKVQESVPQKELLSYIDISLTIFKGILDDNVPENGFDSLNHIDFREWLEHHGLTNTALESGVLQFQYDVCQAYVKGDFKFPSIETGTSLKYNLQIYYCHDDVPDFEEQGGLGDMIFAPMYEVLKRRGVKFKFFYKVENLHLNENNPSLIEEIRITKQVDLIDDHYDPLIDVKAFQAGPMKLSMSK